MDKTLEKTIHTGWGQVFYPVGLPEEIEEQMKKILLEPSKDNPHEVLGKQIDKELSRNLLQVAEDRVKMRNPDKPTDTDTPKIPEPWDPQQWDKPPELIDQLKKVDKIIQYLTHLSKKVDSGDLHHIAMVDGKTFLDGVEVDDLNKALNQKPEDDGWKIHSGDTQPVEDDVMVEVEFMDNIVSRTNQPAKAWGWGEDGSGTIIKYRIIKDK